MMPPVRTILGHIRGVLADQLLPDLVATSWEAAKLRSCITLLTYVDDALRLQPETLPAEIATMAEIVAAALSTPDAHWLDETLRAALAALPPTPPEQPSDDALHHQTRQYRSAVAAIVRHSAAAGEREPAFEALLRSRLMKLSDLDQAVAQRAGQLPPF